MAFIEAGDVKDGFLSWLDTYANVASLGITSKELWEFRNGLLHMTNLSSRAVLKGNTAPLILYVGDLPSPMPVTRGGAKFFSLKGLLDVIAAAVSQWLETYNNPEKLVTFVQRYDLTISDARVAYISFAEPKP